MTDSQHEVERLSDDEKRAIASFKRLAAKWPDTLWLFSGSGGVTILKKTETGLHAHAGEAIDQTYIVGHVDIDADGGDW